MNRSKGGYFIREGVSSIFTHGFMSFASVCIILACLIIMGSFTLLAVNVNHMLKQWEAENQVLAFVDDSLSEEQAEALKTQITGLPNVRDAIFMTNKQAMDSYLVKFDYNELFEDLDETTFRHRFIVYLNDIEQMETTQNELNAISGIAKVNAQLEISRGFVTASRVVAVVSIAIIAVLFVISVFIMANTIKLTTFDRREEIAIMKMVGATDSFIRWPFVVQGLILGLTGALVAFIAQWGLYKLVLAEIARSTVMTIVSPLSFASLALPLLLVFLAVGFVVGIGGSLTVIRKYLHV